MKFFPRWFLVATALSLVTLLCAGAWFYSTQSQYLRKETERDLQAVEQLKVDRINDWLEERVGDASVLVENPIFSETVARYLRDQGSKDAENLMGEFHSLQKSYHYGDVMLVDRDGQVRLSLSDHRGPLLPDAYKTLAVALRERRPMLDLHANSGGLTPNVDIIAPLFAKGDKASEPLAAIVLRMDASRFLYPLLRSWPKPSHSAETLLVRRDGDSVLFLNNLRYQPDSALKLRIPLSKKDVPAVMAVLGTAGVVHGTDYRGTKVMSALMAIPNSPWFMVAKVDEAEALAKWRFRSILILALIAGLLAFLVASLGMAWQRNEKAHYKEQLIAESARRRVEERHRIILMSVGDGIISTDTDGRVELLNPVAEALTGWRQDEARGKPLEEVFRIFNEETGRPVETPVGRVLREGLVIGLANHTLLVAKDGTERPIADSGAPLRNEDGAMAGVVLVFRDQTVERKSRRELEQSEERFRSLIDWTYDWELWIDPSGRITYTSPSGERITGFASEEFIDDPSLLVRIVHPDDKPSFQEHTEGLHRPDCDLEGATLDFRIIARDGSERWIEHICRPLRALDGTYLGSRISNRDITDRKLSEEKNLLLAAIVESSDDAIIGTTTDGIITSWNRGAEKIYGYKETEAVGKPISMLVPTDRLDEVCSLLERMRRGEQVEHFETVRVKKDGREIDVSVTISPIKDAEGRITGASTITRNITELTQACLRLENERSQLRTLVQTIPDLVWLKDPEGIYLACNRRFESFFGAKESDIVGKTDYDFVDADLADFFRDHDRKAMDAGRPSINEEWITFADDGHRELLETIKTPMYGSDGTLIGVLGIGRDITEHRKSEEDRLAHLRFFERMDQVNRAMQKTDDLEQMVSDVLSTLLSIFDCDRAWLVYPCDPEAASWRVPIEHTRPEYPGALALGLEVPMDPDVVRVYRTVLASSGPVKFGPGSEHPLPAAVARQFSEQSQIAMAIHPKGDKPYMFGLHQCSYPRVWTPDEEKLLEVVGRRLTDSLTSLLAFRSVRENEHMLRVILDTSPVGIALSKTWRVEWTNVAWRKMFGWDDEQDCLVHDAKMFYPSEEEDERAVKELYRGLETGNFAETDARFRRKDGSVFYAHVKTKALDPVDPSQGYISVVSDISDRKLAEEALRAASVYNRSLIEASLDPLVTISTEGKITDVNTGTERVTGYLRNELIGKDFADCFTDPEKARTGYQQVFKDGLVKDYELEIRHRDGRLTPVLYNASVYRDESGEITGVLAAARDITEQKNLQRQLLHSQRMEAVGTLAGGVAHDFNNILTVVQGFSEMLLMEMDEKAPVYSDLLKIQESALRGAELVRNLLAFSRKAETKPRPINLNHEVTRIEKLLSRTIPKMIKVELNLEGDLAAVNADPDQMGQVLMNLAVNAEQAMPDGGNLTIATTNVALDEEYCRYYPQMQPGKYVLLTVSDNGHGMDKETLEHIFEPFFTTKGVGKGTGLGLAMVYGIVRQQGGHIECDSEPNEGATFKIYLPAIEEARTEKQDREELALPRGGTETILLVDDEDFVRDLGMKFLTRAGYTVLTATSGPEALRLYLKEAERISLVILDLIMPEMGGEKCLEEILAMNPDAKIVISSGAAVEGKKKETLESGARGFVSKPFQLRDMLKTVREVLDSA